MVHISRHKSHRSRKHRDRSVTDDEDISKEKKQKLEAESVRISRSPDQEKVSRSSNHVVLAGKDNVISDNGKRPKDIGERWNGDGDENTKVDKEAKGENSETEFGRRSKGKSVSSSSKKGRDISEKIEEKRMDKQSSRRESSSNLHKDSKEKEKEKQKEREKEKVYAKEKEKKECSTKHKVEVSELSEEMHNSEQTKEIGRPYKRRDKCSDNKKVHDSRDSRSKRSYKDGGYTERYRDEHDREYRHYNEKRRRDEHSSRTQSGMSDSRSKKIKLQCSDNGGSCYNDDHITKHVDSKGRKRLPEEIGDQAEVINQNAKKPYNNAVKCRSSSTKHDQSPEGAKADHSYAEKADSSASSIRLKISPRTSYPAKDQNWDQSRQNEDTHQSPSDVRERISEFGTPSVKESDLSPQSVSLTSPNHLPKKVPCTNQHIPAERGQKSNNAAVSNTSNNQIPPSPSINKFRSSGSRWPSPVTAECFMPVQHGPPLGFPHPAVPRFPSNVGPYNNVHMHSYSMQTWDGNHNMQVYGRQEWDQNRLLTVNRVWKASSNNNTWNGQHGNMYPNHNTIQKETEYYHEERVKPEKQVDGVSKIPLDVSDSSKSLGEKTSEPFKTSSVKKTSEKVEKNVSYIHYYLSKLDVSPELAHPDVYKQCILLMEGTDVKNASQNLSMGQRKNNLDSFRPVAKSRQSLLIHPLDTIFEKAMFLFNKQKEGSKFKKVVDVMNKEERKNGNEAEGATSESNNVQEIGNIIKSEETENSANAADSNADVVCVGISERRNNIANPKSVKINISQILLSAESTL